MKSGYRILVVDDDASVLFTYRLLLQKNGYAVTAVLSSADAKTELEQQQYDLLLCDLSLEQGHTGFEVLEHAWSKTGKLPCILLTGYANAESAKKADKLGVKVLYKPIDVSEFLSAIPTVLKENYEQRESSDVH